MMLCAEGIYVVPSKPCSFCGALDGEFCRGDQPRDPVIELEALISLLSHVENKLEEVKEAIERDKDG